MTNNFRESAKVFEGVLVFFDMVLENTTRFSNMGSRALRIGSAIN